MGDQIELRKALEGLQGEPQQLIEIILRQATAIEQLQQQIKALEDQIRDLNDRNGKLQGRIEELERAAARPAAPFRIKDKHRVITPQKPGRKAGHPAAYRPVPTHIDEQITVPLNHCPHCQGSVQEVRPVVQYIEDLPPIRPRVTQLTTHCAYCPECQTEVRSSHPLQVSLAEGAAGVQLGPQALAVATELNKHHGLTVRKTQAVLEGIFNLKVSAGGLVQAMARLATRLRPDYEAMLEQLRNSAVMHSDETSWWVGAPGWWLWVFATSQQTVYHVAQGRGRQVLLGIIGLDYAGVLVSDCLGIYDDVNRQQHKCYSHHLKAISQAAEQKPSDYLEQLRALLKAAMALKGLQLDPQEKHQHRAALEQRADQLLLSPRTEVLEEKVRRRLFKQRDHLFTFLDHASVPATNNLAERQLRPAVIARKVSCGNKTPAGARAWEVLASLAATCRQRGDSFLRLVAAAARPPPRPAR
jgi:transposase